MSDVVFVESNGIRITEWTSYTVDSDLLIPADGFLFTVEVPGTPEARHRLMEATKPGSEVRVYVGADVGAGARQDRYLQMVGIIDDRRIGATRDSGTTISIEGRDLAGALVDSSVELNIQVKQDMRLVDLVQAAVERYGIEVTTDSYAAQRTLQAGGRRASTAEGARRAGVPPDWFSITAQEEARRTGRPLDDVAGEGDGLDISTIQARAAARSGYANHMGPSDVSRLTVKNARPQVGETVWAFIERHCARLGVLAWFSPKGRLILSSPRYDQPPRYRAVRRYVDDPADPNNVEEGELLESIGDRFSEVVVYGRGNPRSTERTPLSGTATEDAWPSRLPKPLYIQDSSVRSAGEAARVALRELMRARQSSFELTYTLPGHGQRGYLYAVDSTIAVVDDVVGVDGTFYITKRTFRKDRDNGTTTTIRAVPLRSLVY